MRLNPDITLRGIATCRQRNEDLPIWIDAICINQSDYAEKGHHVYSMNLICKLAVVVRRKLETTGNEEMYMYNNELVAKRAAVAEERERPKIMWITTEGDERLERRIDEYKSTRGLCLRVTGNLRL